LKKFIQVPNLSSSLPFRAGFQLSDPSTVLV